MFWQREFPSRPYSICIEYRELDESLQLKTSHIERHWRHEQREFNPFSYSNLLKDTQDLLILYIQVQMQNKTMAIYKEKPFKMPISDHIHLAISKSKAPIKLTALPWSSSLELLVVCQTFLVRLGFWIILQSAKKSR